ncbi:AsmA family protein [Alsobacter sp. SYSU BS001988]
MTRRALAAAGLIALVVVAGATSWTVPTAKLQRTMSTRLLGIPGVRIVADEHARFTALPEPRLEVGPLKVLDAAGALVFQAERVSGSLRLLPLIAGRLEFADLLLVRPVVARAASVSAAAVLEQVSKAVPPASGSSERPSTLAGINRLVIVDGAAEGFEAADSAAPVSHLNAVVRRVQKRGVIDAAATLMWRGQAVDFASHGLDLAALADRASSPLDVAIKTPLGSLRFAGATVGSGVAEADGAIEVTTPSLGAAARWLRVKVPLPISETMQARGAARISPTALALSNAVIALEAGELDGVLALKLIEGQLTLGGTLAADRLDLTTALRPFFPKRDADGGWSRDSIDPAATPSPGVDVRVSAATLTVGKLTLGNAAFSLLSRDGRTDVTLGNAELFGGAAKGRLTLSGTASSGLEVKAQGSFDRLDAAKAFSSMTGAEKLSGSASGAFALEASGDAPASLMRSLEGRAALTVRQGELIGINLPEVLRRIEKRPLIAALDIRGGRTPFDTATVSGRISRGVLEIGEAVLSSPATRVTLAGQIGVGDRTLLLSGQAQAAEREAAALPFEVSGSFDDPIVAPDAKNLIRRSGAAAPFFGSPRAIVVGEPGALRTPPPAETP